MIVNNKKISVRPCYPRMLLSPIKKTKKIRLLQQKQNNFILDCTNKQKSQLEQYNYMKDKYLNYCVVKIPKRKRIIVNAIPRKRNKQNNTLDPIKFKDFLLCKRQEVISRCQQIVNLHLEDQGHQSDYEIECSLKSKTARVAIKQKSDQIV